MNKAIFTLFFLVVAATVSGEEIAGVGIVLQPGGDASPVKVNKVLAATPAAKAGIREGFLILSIDGGSTAGKALAECARLIRGAPQTKVSLEVVDPDLGETNRFVLVREVISIPISIASTAFAPAFISLVGKPLPDLAPYGVNSTNVPPDQPLLVVLVDIEQRPSRRALKLLYGQEAGLRQKGIAVVVLQAGSMSDEAFAEWKRETEVSLPVTSLKGEPRRARQVLGAAALPWLILTDKAHQVVSEGLSVEEVETRLQEGVLRQQSLR